MIFKRKRKEKAKRGSLLKKALIAALIILLALTGIIYWVLKPSPQPEIAVDSFAGSISFQGNCSFSQGFGTRENSEIGSQILNALEQAEISVTRVAVEDKVTEYQTCGEEVTPLYQLCTELTVAMAIESTDPTERELGSHIADVLDVLTAENFCTPEEKAITFENPRGNITWQMSYALAMEAYKDGARGVELYDPRARR
jgi:hypothetical protein